MPDRGRSLRERGQESFQRSVLERRPRLPVRRRRCEPRAWAEWMPRSARIKSSPSAACRSRFLKATQAQTSCRSRRATTVDAAGAAVALARRPGLPPALSRRCHRSATAPITKARRGRGSSARSSRPGFACTATHPITDGWLATRFVQPLVDHLHDAGIGHVSEIADGDPPHTPRGCPFQAWSLGELLRLTNVVLREQPAPIDHLATADVSALARAGP